MKTKKKKLAIFDIDGTVFRSSLLIRLLDILTLEKVCSENVHREITHVRSKWFNREITYEKYQNTLVDILKNNIAGIKQETVKKYSKRLVKLQKSIYFDYTNKIIKRIRNKYVLIAISGSLIETLEELNKHLKFDFVFGTQFEVKNGIYTGIILEEPVKDKKSFLKSFVKNNNLDMKDSIGIGDTDADIGMLELVDNPTVFNPDMELYKYAQKKKWKVVVERKNVIYDIK